MQPGSEDSSATMNEDGAGDGALAIDEPAEIPVREGPIHVPAGSTATKVCPSCSVQSETLGAFCPSCGSAYDRSRSAGRRSLALIGILVAAVLIVGGGATAVALTVGHNNEVAARQKAAAAASAQQAADDDAKRALREADTTEVETSITKDAQGRVTAGTLDGPITKTSCTPLGGGSTDDLTALTTTFTCIAINKENTDGTEGATRSPPPRIGTPARTPGTSATRLRDCPQRQGRVSSTPVAAPVDPQSRGRSPCSREKCAFTGLITRIALGSVTMDECQTNHDRRPVDPVEAVLGTAICVGFAAVAVFVLSSTISQTMPVEQSAGRAVGSSVSSAPAAPASAAIPPAANPPVGTPPVGGPPVGIPQVGHSQLGTSQVEATPVRTLKVRHPHVATRHAEVPRAGDQQLEASQLEASRLGAAQAGYSQIGNSQDESLQFENSQDGTSPDLAAQTRYSQVENSQDENQRAGAGPSLRNLHDGDYASAAQVSNSGYPDPVSVAVPDGQVDPTAVMPARETAIPAVIPVAPTPPPAPARTGGVSKPPPARPSPGRYGIQAQDGRGGAITGVSEGRHGADPCNHSGKSAPDSAPQGRSRR